jgi:hypothetical protein
MHQIKKQLSFLSLHCHHIQGDVLQSIAKAIPQSPSPTHIYRIKSHTGIIGNEYVDALARKLFTTYSNVAGTSIKRASPEGNSFCSIKKLKQDHKNKTQIALKQQQQ